MIRSRTARHRARKATGWLGTDVGEEDPEARDDGVRVGRKADVGLGCQPGWKSVCQKLSSYLFYCIKLKRCLNAEPMRRYFRQNLPVPAKSTQSLDARQPRRRPANQPDPDLAFIIPGSHQKRGISAGEQTLLSAVTARSTMTCRPAPAQCFNRRGLGRRAQRLSVCWRNLLTSGPP